MHFAFTLFFLLLAVWIGLELYKRAPDYFVIDEDRNISFKRRHFDRPWHDDDEDFDDFDEDEERRR